MIERIERTERIEKTERIEGFERTLRRKTCQGLQRLENPNFRPFQNSNSLLENQRKFGTFWFLKGYPFAEARPLSLLSPLSPLNPLNPLSPLNPLILVIGPNRFRLAIFLADSENGFA